MVAATGQHRMRISHFLIVLLLLCHARHGSSQHIIGTYKTTAPDASLFFLNPGYLSPAYGGGVLGLHSNPAGLHVVKGNRLSMAYATPQTASSQFSFQAPQENELYIPFRVDMRLDMQEIGGLGAVGFAHRSGSWVWGISIMQAHTGSLSLEANGQLELDAQFEIDTPITKEQYSDLPVDELPVIWVVNTTGHLRMSSSPAEVSISAQPILAGCSVQKGPFSLGLGLAYYRYYSNKNIGEFSSQLNANAVVTGLPYGIEPNSDMPWSGRLVADLTIHDSPLLAQYLFDLSGYRLAMSFGGMMNLKLLSLGFNYSLGLPSAVKGAYNITTISTIDVQDRNILSDVDLDLSMFEEDGIPLVEGRAKLELSEFKKDTVMVRDRGTFALGGYHSMSAGLHFLIFGAFGGIEIPKTNPELYSSFLGLYSDFPLPKLPLRLNIGLTARMDGVVDKTSLRIPYRTVAHVGAGVAFKLPLDKWAGIGKEPGWFRIGVRSSLAAQVLDSYVAKLEDASNVKTGSLFDRIAWSFGLMVPY